MAFNIYTITTAAEADKELTRAIAALESGLDEIDQIALEMIEIIKTMSSSKVSLARVAEVPKSPRSYNNREDTSLEDMGAERRDMRDGTYKWEFRYGKVGQIAYEFSQLGEVLPGRTRAPVRWFGSDDLGTVSTSDAEKFQQLWSLAGELSDAIRGLNDSKNEYRAIQNRYLSVTDNTRDLIGTYVRASTSRRDIEGFVVGGRGKTMHIVADPFEYFNLRRRTMFSYEPLFWHNTKDLASNIIHATRRSKGDPNKQTFTKGKDGVDIEIIYSKRMTAAWKKTVAEWVAKVEAAEAEARTQLEPMLKWEADGGLLAEARKQKVDSVLRGRLVNATAMKAANDSYTGSVARAYLWAADTILDQATKDAITEAVRTKALSEVGGPLTEKEEELLATKPAGDGGSAIFDTARRILADAGPLK